MKITIKIVLFAMLIVNCKKDDDNNRQVNTAPEAFALLTVENKEEEAPLNPTFTWQPAIDVDGDSVVYDLYLETKNSTNISLLPNAEPVDPSNIIAQGITKPIFTITTPLPINTTFTWKVVARDNQGGSVSSDIFRFSTRLLNLSEEALTSSAAFDVREGHGSVFFKGKFWVIGGFANIEDLKNDVWSSTDGGNWVLETSDAGFSGRSRFGITVFKDRIFIVGGSGAGGYLGDVWSSADGVNWIQETASANFNPRRGLKLVSYKDKLYALGGFETNFDATDSSDDIWSSTNGVDWVQQTDAAPYGVRSGFEALVFDDKIFMLGGLSLTTHKTRADVWYSKDGKNWTQVANSGSSFSERLSFSGTVFNGKIWLTAGYFNDGEDPLPYTDFWSSSDGNSWKREILDAGYEGRSSSTMISNHEYMLLIGGGKTNNSNKFNDVWKFD